MIVTCQECSTSFQLDDARIPASGARVRCSRCKHSFFIQNPSSSQSQAIESVVAEAIQGKAGKAPAASRDLGAPPASAERAPVVRGEPEEEDWQFSQEIRVAGDDEEDEAGRGRPGSPDPSSFDLTGDFGHGLDPNTPSEAPPATGAASTPKSVTARPPASTPSAPARDESSFGSIDDFSSLIEDEDDGVPVELATESTASTQRVARRATAPSDDLGDPESWDLVGGDDARHAQSTVAALVRPPKRAASKVSTASLDLFAEGELPPANDEREESSATHPHWARVGKLVGWCVTAASVAVVGGLLLGSEWARRAEVPQRLELGPLVAVTTRSGWLESSRAGFLLVFEGELRNTGRQPVKPIALQLVLLDGAGERLAEPPLRVGQVLAANALRESSPEDLAQRRKQAISGWLATPIAPGEVRRFSAVAPADQLPVRARRALLEAVPTPKP